MDVCLIQRSIEIDRVRSKQASRLLTAILLVVAGTGCAVRRGPSPDVFHDAAERGFIDLQPGWRIRVVIPILKSGGYLPTITEQKQEDGSVRLSTSADLVGYETAYYRVRQRKDQGVKIELASVSLTEDGKETKRDEPVLQLFDPSDSIRFVRLLYLLRISEADHDTAILGANTPALLDELTAKIQADSTVHCVVSDRSYCMWAPKGVGVRVENSGH
jgi:hypothetical protein